MSGVGNYAIDRPASLRGSRRAATGTLLIRLAAGEDVVTRRFNGPGPGLRLAHRLGYVESQRFGPPRIKRRRLTGEEISYWRHTITPRGRQALVEVMPYREIGE